MIKVLVFLSYFYYTFAVDYEKEPWKLPVLPYPPPSRALGNETLDKLIPRHLWMAVSTFKDGLNYHLPALFKRNPNWEVHIVTNDMKDEFMNKTFANTSLLWAYHMIDPIAGAAKADLWRYAALWTYGGAYIDDDSDIKTPLDQVVGKDDTCIVSYEKNGFNGDRCYIPSYHLSDYATFRNPLYKGRESFYGRILLNWAMILAPRHILLEEMMKNSVDIIRQEYFQDPVLRMLNDAFRWEVIMCSTGPSMLTGTARELVLRNDTRMQYRLAGSDFNLYGGRFKAVYRRVRDIPNHYMTRMVRSKGHKILLREYLEEPPVTKEHLQAWQGHAIKSQNGKAVYFIDKGKKRPFGDYATFFAMNFTDGDVIVISDTRILLIPTGETLPKMKYDGWK